MSCADLKGITTDQVPMDKADLSFSNLVGANLLGVKGLKNNQLVGVDYDPNTTRFPRTVNVDKLAAPLHYPGPNTCGNRLDTLAAKGTGPSPSAPATGPPPPPLSSSPPLPSPDVASSSGP